eukprot:9115233-Pyramimonas_sp.AAC.1
MRDASVCAAHSSANFQQGSAALIHVWWLGLEVQAGAGRESTCGALSAFYGRARKSQGPRKTESGSFPRPFRRRWTVDQPTVRAS